MVHESSTRKDGPEESTRSQLGNDKKSQARRASSKYSHSNASCEAGIESSDGDQAIMVPTSSYMEFTASSDRKRYQTFKEYSSSKSPVKIKTMTENQYQRMQSPGATEEINAGQLYGLGRLSATNQLGQRPSLGRDNLTLRSKYTSNVTKPND